MACVIQRKFWDNTRFSDKAGKQQTHYEIDMCNGPILPKLLRFAVPLMCSSVLQLLFNAADYRGGGPLGRG